MRFAKIFLFLFLLYAPLAKAQDFQLTSPFYEVDVLDVKIKIDQRGEVTVLKKFLLSIPSSTFLWSEDLPISELSLFAGTKELEKSEYQLKKEKDRLVIKASKTLPSQAFSLHFKAPESLKPSPESSSYDRLSLSLVSKPGVYIRELSATLTLPQTIPKNQLKQKVYAIHGVGKSDFYPENGQALVYKGSDLSPFSTYSIQAEWPKGVILYPFLKRVSFFIQALSLKFWLGLAIVLPLFAFLLFFYMLYLKKRNEKLLPLTYFDKPPEPLPPALVGVLLREEATQREITATILDLAQRGFIDIVKKREEYVLGKRQGRGGLRPFEAFLYDKLFTQQGERKIKRTEFEIETRAAEQLYSPKISQFYQELYQETQKRGYFVKNPALVALKFKIYGISFFLLAIVTSFLAIKFSPGPPYALFGTFGQIIASFLIIKIAPLLPKRTEAGKKALSAWLSFGQFLSDKKPLGLSAAQEGLFERNLPYAVALGKEVDWAVRFSEIAYNPPSWYSSQELVTLENFASSLFYITGSLSQLLYGLREPSL